MKFGEYLLQHQFTPWATEYLQYDRIKKVIRETQDRKVVDQWLETEFVKIKGFLSRQTESLQHQLQCIDKTTQSSGPLGDDLVYPLYDLHDLVRYLDLCSAGFKKLAKAYTKHLQITTTRHDFILKSLNQYYVLFNQLFVRMASIKNNRSQAESKMKALPPMPSSSRDLYGPLPPLPNNDDRIVTSYYWIHPAHVFELKTLLLIYATFDQCHPLSTVYFDNSEWSVYNSQLDEQIQSVDFVECTWSGFIHATNGNIQVNHHQQDHNVTATKRHTLSWTSFNSCLRDLQRTSQLPPTKEKAGIRLSTATNDDLMTAVIVEPRSKMDAEEQQLDQALRDRIQQQHWRPTATRSCERTTMTLSTIDIHLDTNMMMAAGFGEQQGDSLPTGFAMMTVVQHLNHDDSLGRTAPKQQEWPAWLKQLTENCDWIHAVPRFSMYVHLVSRLYGDQVPLLPWWLGYFDRSWLDSRGKNGYGLSRSIGLEPLLHGAAVSSLLTHPTNNHMTLDIDNEEEDDDMEKDVKMLLPKSTTPNIPAMTTSAKLLINNMVKNTTKRMTKPRKTTTFTPTMKIKVEPKVFFANERTFLSWLQFCALLLTVSLNMINFGGQDDSISRLCGGMFIIITILMALYALAKYEFRAWNLLTRSSRYRFDDVYGPAILCLLLVVAMLINFGLRLNAPPGRQSSSE